MGSITPLLDTLLHQVLGRQLSLEAYARQPIGPSAVSAVIRDGAIDDDTQSSDNPAYDKEHAEDANDFVDTISRARSRQQETDTPSVRSAVVLPKSSTSLPGSPSVASAQLALSNTARILSEQAYLVAQQTLLSDLSARILAGTDMPAQSKHSSAPSSQPSMLLPLEEQDIQATPHNRPPLLYLHDEINDLAIGISSSSDSASLEVSQTARQLNQWTTVLSQQDWQSLLSSEKVTPIPLRFLSTALIMDTMGQDISLEMQRDVVSSYLATALKTSGLFHESLLLQWAHDNLPLEIVEQSAHQRQQLLSTLPAAPDFGDAVIRHQLQLMAGQPIHFQSELWAGATMLMSFRTEPYESATHHDSSAERHFPTFPEQRRVWTLMLTFELPILGTVTARIQWNGESLSVTLGAECSETQKLLAEFQEQLEQLLNDGNGFGRAVDIYDSDDIKAAMNIFSMRDDTDV